MRISLKNLLPVLLICLGMAAGAGAQKSAPPVYVSLGGGIGSGVSMRTTYGTYTYERVKTGAAGLLLQPTFELVPNRVFGMSFGPQILVAPDYAYGGVSVGFVIGQLHHIAMLD